MIKLFLLASYLVLLVLQIEPICANNIRESDVFGIKRSESAKVAQMNCEQSSIIEHRDETQTVDIRFPAIKVTQDDQYMCTSHQVPFGGTLNYITSFTPHALANSSHHMLVFGCSTPFSTKSSWKCQSMGQICGDGKSQIIYAWAKDAPPLVLPHDIGVRVGGSTSFRYLVVQMHFAHKLPPGHVDCSGFSATATTVPQQYYAGIFLLGANWLQIPQHTDLYSSDVGCNYGNQATLQVFGFRTHAHSLGTVITGYRVRNRVAKMIGKGNPQWPHAFYPRVGGTIDIQPGDMLEARCNYKSDKSTVTYAGMRGDDEMCNFYMMYYTNDTDITSTLLECWGKQTTLDFPSDANSLAPYPGFAGEDSVTAIESGRAKIPSIPSTATHSHNHHSKNNIVLEGVLNWPQQSNNNNLGQVGGVATDNEGSVHVFHRSYRRWDSSSFDQFNHFTSKEPISSDTIYKYDSVSGSLVHSWGAGLFFLPHGITVDNDNNIWLTDVALHQVFKFPQNGSNIAELVLGERLVPGSDDFHFCKPTDVAIETDGTFYVADGYCNGRVLKYSSNGQLIKTWGEKASNYYFGIPQPGFFKVAHSITLCNHEQDVCVADRENGRVQCFDKFGKFLKIIENKKMIGSFVYAIECTDTNGGLMFAVNGKSRTVKTSGFTIDYSRGEIINQWEPSNVVDLSNPHDVTVSRDGNLVYVGELDPHKVYEFKVINSNESGLTSKETAEKSTHSDSLKKTGEEHLVGQFTVDNDELNVGSIFIVWILALLSIPAVVLIISIVYVRVRSRRLNNAGGMMAYNIYDKKSVEQQPLIKRDLGFGNFFKMSNAEKHKFKRVNTEDIDEVGNLETESEDECK